jgi:hypothetical protein
MKRTKRIYGKDLLNLKFKTFAFDGVYLETMGTPEINGLFLIYGDLKQGKTSFSLMFAEYLSQFEKAAYISAEQGISSSFQSTYSKVIKNPNSKRLSFEKRMSFEQIAMKYAKREAPKIIFIDNLTAYDGLRKSDIYQLRDALPNHLLVFIAHEDDRGKPKGATGKLCAELADKIIQVTGMACKISGRDAKGILMIDEEKALLYHGTEITQ